MQIIILHSVGFNAGAGSVSALSSDDTNPRGGAHIFSNGATNPVNQSSAKGDTSVLNNDVLIQQDIIPEVHLNTVRDYNIFDGDATNPWRKQQSVKGLRTLDLSLRFQCREGLSQRSPKDFVSNIYMSVRAFKLLATAFNFNVATGLKQEISSFYAAAVSTQDLFYESKVNFKYSDDFNVRYSLDLGVALMSAAPVLSIMTQISAASMLLIMAPMPAAPMLSLMAPMPAAQIPNPDQIAYWHSAPRHAFVAHYFCDHILAIMIASSTPCQEWQSKSIVKYCFETAGYKLIVALKYATRCSSDFQITAFLCKERAIFREGDVGRPSTSEGYDITITSSAKPHSVLVREGDGEYGIERAIAFTFSTSIELGASEKVRAIRHRRESRHRPHHEYHTRIKLSRIRPRRSNSWRSSSHCWRNVNRKCRSHRVAKRQQSSANEKDCSENYVIYKPHPIVLIDDSSVCEGGSTTRTILFAFLSAVMVTSTTDLASSIRERDRNTQGIARAITFKSSDLCGSAKASWV